MVVLVQVLADAQNDRRTYQEVVYTSTDMKFRLKTFESKCGDTINVTYVPALGFDSTEMRLFLKDLHTANLFQLQQAQFSFAVATTKEGSLRNSIEDHFWEGADVSAPAVNANIDGVYNIYYYHVASDEYRNRDILIDGTVARDLNSTMVGTVTNKSVDGFELTIDGGTNQLNINLEGDYRHMSPQREMTACKL